ncbi:MAG: hypothetical protein JSW71_20205 [Gemmatimonadota bacterium]|nr:MAG: hypothetical protein JSW71_20205 [Gemmatimonadota bacterium]
MKSDPKVNVMEVWQQLLSWVQESPYQWREAHELEELRDPDVAEHDPVLDLYLPVEW